jgi:hypothetical protein
VVKKVHVHHGKWDISAIKFPVALYDKHSELHTADSATKLNEILKTFHSPATVLVYEVPQGSGFVWFQFEWGQLPRLVNAIGIDTLPLDVDMYDRVAKTWRMFFRELPKMRLQFVVSHNKKFKLMGGVYMN